MERFLIEVEHEAEKVACMTAIRIMFTAGAHRVVWNGKDNLGRPLSSGVYFLNLQSEGESETMKMMLVR